jgi:hypothetical protein
MINLKQVFENEKKMDLTYDSELRNYLNKYSGMNEYVFNDILMKDQIKNLPQNKKLFCIVNYDTSEKSGSHWVAIVKDNNIVFYFDSYGIYPLKEVKQRYPNKKIIYNDYAVQKINSNICGHLCIAFIEHIVVKQKSYYDFLTECDKYSTRYKNDHNK